MLSRSPLYLAATLLVSLYSGLARAQSAGTVTLTANRTSANGSFQPTLTWSTSPAASSCTASGGWSGAKTASGTQVIATINASTNYTLTCSWGSSGTGSVRVSWTPPTTNSNGSPLTNLARYRVLYGTSSSALNQSRTINDPSATSATISSLAAGTWFFAVRSVNTSNVESASSNVASRSVTGGSGGSASGSVAITIPPPPAGSLATNSRNAWDVMRRSDGVWVRRAVVGTIAIGRPCSKSFRAGLNHFVVNRSDVTLISAPQSTQLVVSCAPR